MLLRIVIYHLSGPKIKQVEQFACEAFSELTIGTQPGCAIQFDGADDISVGDKHASIKITSDEPPHFVLRDLGSRSGTFLNGQPIGNAAEIAAGDEVELGRGGPKFAFDVVSPRTRVVSLADAAGASEAEREHRDEATAVQLPVLAQIPSGRLSVEPAAAGQSSDALPNRTIAWAAALLALLVAVGIGLYPMVRRPASEPQGDTPARMAAAAPRSPGAVPAEFRELPRPVAVEVAASLKPEVPRPVSPPEPVAVAPPPEPQTERTAALPAAPEVAAVEITAGADASGISDTPDAPRPDLAGTVRKIAGASRFMIGDQWIELYGIDDPTSRGEHNRAVYQYLKPFGGVTRCYAQADSRFKCFAGRQDLAIIAIRKHLVRLTADAPPEYRVLMRDLATAGR